MTTLLTPGDAGYDDARRIHNGMIDKHPAVIARCTSTADVVEAVRLGRESGGEVAVRGGGHNVAGKAVTEGGVMIDLSPMRGIDVDPTSRFVRAQPGVTWGEFTAAAPDDLGVACGLVHAPDGSGNKIVALPLCHAGEDPKRAEADIKALREFGPPVLDAVDVMPYPVVNTLLDGGFPAGAYNYWKSAF